MTTLLLAEHDNKTLKDATQQGADRRQGARRRRACAGRRQGLPRPAADAAAKLDGVAKVLLADGAAYEHCSPSRWPR